MVALAGNFCSIASTQHHQDSEFGKTHLFFKLRSLPIGDNVTRKMQNFEYVGKKASKFPVKDYLGTGSFCFEHGESHLFSVLRSPGLPTERRDSHSGPVDLPGFCWLSWWDFFTVVFLGLEMDG